MLKDIIYNRYSGRIWDEKSVDQKQISYILDCALKAPSKQCMYPYEIHVITDSQEGKDFKEFLFWNDTWCADGLRANPEQVYSTDKRYNGQYRAPVLLCWTNRTPDLNISNESIAFKNKEDWAREQALVDATVSSSFAMLAAEELGLQTSFGRCHTEIWKNSVFGKDEKELYMEYFSFCCIC